MFLHSGSTLFNLALTGRPFDGWKVGRMSNVIGDKSTGKTLIAIEAAKIALDTKTDRIKGTKIYYHETESAFDRPYAQSLGLDTTQVEFLGGDTIEQANDNIVDVCHSMPDGYVGLYVLDSWDALTAEAEIKKEIDAGSYAMDKQKKASEMFRRQIRLMEQSRLHLMIISQIRDNITTLPFAPKYRRAGGKALDFYASQVVWLQERKKLKQKNMVYGLTINAKVSKNKVANPFREATFPIIFGYGMDDIFSLLTWLSEKEIPVESRVKKVTGGYYLFAGQRLQMAGMIAFLEANPREYAALIQQAHDAWQALEDALKAQRLNKVDLLSAVRGGNYAEVRGSEDETVSDSEQETEEEEEGEERVETYTRPKLSRRR